MGLFDHKTNITLSAHSNVFTSTPSQMRIIKILALLRLPHPKSLQNIIMKMMNFFPYCYLKLPGWVPTQL